MITDLVQIGIRIFQTRARKDPVKIGVAAQLRRETTMTLKWIAERLQTGAWTHLNKQLYEHRKEGGGSNVE